MSLNLLVKERALALGFDLAGVASISAWADLAFSREWVERGYAGEMDYLGNPKRDDPRLVLPAAKSVVCVGLIYNSPLPYSTEATKGQRAADRAADAEAKPGDVPRGWISRYAWGRDYHEIMRPKMDELRREIEALAPGAETRAYVDTGPVVERAFARYSGIGWTGKNTCLINQEKGSWFFIGVVLTNLDLAPDLPAADRCGSCTRCIEACPTDALVEPYVMDASRCIAYFTIELKGSIPLEFRSSIGSNVFGCDVCQDVCPWNSHPWNSQGTAGSSVAGEWSSSGRDQSPRRNQAPENDDPKATKSPTESLAVSDEPDSIREPTGLQANRGFRHAATTTLPEFQPLHLGPAGSGFSLFNPSLEDLTSITEEDFRHLFAHSPLKRPKYRGWLRNLCVVIGNSGDPKFIPWLERICEHPDAIVREHAEWALAQLNRQRAALGVSNCPRL